MFAILVGNLKLAAADIRTFGGRFLRPHGTASDPALDVRQFGRRKFVLRRHLEFVVFVTDGFEQQAFFRLSWDDRRALISASQDRGAGIETQTALLLRRPVTLQAVLDEQRANLALEKRKIGGVGWSVRGDQQQYERNQNEKLRAGSLVYCIVLGRQTQRCASLAV